MTKTIYILIDAINEDVDPFAFDSEGKLRKAIEDILDSYNLESFTKLTNLSQVNDHFGTNFRTYEIVVE